MARPAACHGLLDADGQQAAVGRSTGYWLDREDFVASGEEAPLEDAALEHLGFPRDWPAAYTQSAALKSLIGKKGKLACRRAAVAGLPTQEQLAQAGVGAPLWPLQSLENAERAASSSSGLGVVRGWAVFERHDRAPGACFVAERYWWNVLPDGTWVDLSPRPKGFDRLLLAEAAEAAARRRSVLTAAAAALASRLLAARFPEAAAAPARAALLPAAGGAAAAAASPASPAAPPRPAATAPATVAPSPPVRVPASAQTVQAAAKPLDYSKWSCLEDSEDEAAATSDPRSRGLPQYGARDLAEGQKPRGQPPVPDYLVGTSGGGGGTNCYPSLCRLLDKEGEIQGDNAHQLCQAFGKIFRVGMLDRQRQDFFRDAIASVPSDTFIVILGLGSILPALQVARRPRGGAVLLEASSKLADLASAVFKASGAKMPVVPVAGGLDKEEVLRSALANHVPANAGRVVLLTELFAPDLLSSGLVAVSVAAHKAVQALAPGAKVEHLPRTVELSMAPLELRTDRLSGFDIRPFNAFRNTSSNDKADFWWWGVRLDNQPNTTVSLLGPSQTLCGFDLDRASEISFDEVRRNVKMKIDRRGRCNAVAMWWTATYGGKAYSTKPRLAAGPRPAEPCRSEWKQAVHYLAGETSVFVGDSVEVLLSLMPRFTVRMMQMSPFSVEAPLWVKAPTSGKASATLPILPYHFLMLTDIHRLQVYGDAIRDAVRQQRKRLGRRVRVLDAGAGVGLLGMTAALEGADVWLCEAVPMMRQMCREVLGANAQAIAEKEGLVQLLPAMLSSRIQVGEDVPHRFDIVVAEVLDLWGLGEGVIPTMRHAHKSLLAEGGTMLPSRMVVFAQPLELHMWGDIERDAKADLSPLAELLKCKFSPMRINQVQHRMLSEEPWPVLDIDLRNVPAQPPDGTPNLDGVSLCIRMGGKPAYKAKMTSIPISTGGMLCGYGVWWAADLCNGHVITNAPTSPQRSWKQLVRWLDAPRFAAEGEDVQVLSCFNEHQVNVEDVYVPKGMLEKYQEQLSGQIAAQQGKACPAEPGKPSREDARRGGQPQQGRKQVQPSQLGAAPSAEAPSADRMVEVD